MYLPCSTGRFLALFLALAITVYANKTPLKSVKAFSCKGGSIYFAAHPADLLLYQNPDLFHDLWVWKCTTAVLFTSGDRGVVGNYSRSIERGLEDAFAFMGSEQEEPSWTGADVQFNGKVVLLRSLKTWPQVQLVFLRLPDGKPDGLPYRDDGESLKQLYDKDISSITATDASATYTLDSLKELLATVMKKREANDIRILRHKEPVTKELEANHDHMDHLVSSRLVAEVVNRENITANIIAYASGSMHSLARTLDDDNLRVKHDAYMKYALYDRHVCDNQVLCNPRNTEDPDNTGPCNDDTGYVTKWLEREYYVK